MSSILPKCLTYWLDRRQMSFQTVLLVELLWTWDLSSLRCRSPFGKAQDATYQAQQLDNSIDLNGDGILFYPNFQVHIKAGKNITSNLPCEIYTADGTLTLNTIEHVRSAIFSDHQGNQVQLPYPTGSSYDDWGSCCVCSDDPATRPDTLPELAGWCRLCSWFTLYTMRQTAGIRFEAENENQTTDWMAEIEWPTRFPRIYPHSNSTIWAYTCWRKPPRSEPNRNW